MDAEVEEDDDNAAGGNSLAGAEKKLFVVDKNELLFVKSALTFICD